MTLEPVFISGHGLTIQEIVDVARGFRPLKLDPPAADSIRPYRHVVDDLVRRKVKVYGLTTGFASLRDVTIDAGKAGDLSRRLIVSHSAGVGQPFPEDIVRKAILLRAQALAVNATNNSINGGCLPRSSRRSSRASSMTRRITMRCTESRSSAVVACLGDLPHHRECLR